MLGGMCSLYVLLPSKGLPLACAGVLRALPDHLHRHRWCNAGGIKKEHGFRVEVDRAILFELVTAADEWRYPRAVRV
jgi:hypothetical protein